MRGRSRRGADGGKGFGYHLLRRAGGTAISVALALVACWRMRGRVAGSFLASETGLTVCCTRTTIYHTLAHDLRTTMEVSSRSIHLVRFGMMPTLS